jgi:DNA-binding GntR family transcriptional regulator
VFAALKARDPEGAESMMKTHLLRQRAALKALDAGAPAQAVRAPPGLRVAGKA